MTAGAERLAVRLGKDGLHLLESPVEVLQGHAEEGGRDDRPDVHVLLLQLDAGLAGEDQELAQGIPSAEVQARVRLGESGFLRGPHQRGESGSFPVGAEDLVQGAGDDGLNALHFIGTVGADGQGLQHRKRRAHGGLIAEEAAVFAGSGLQGGIFHIGDGEGAPVGRDDVQARPEQVRIAPVQGLAVGAVHEDGPPGRQVDDRVHEVAGDASVQGGDAPAQVDAVVPAVGQTRHAERLPGAFGHGCGRVPDHGDEGPAHRPGPGDEQAHFPDRMRLEEGPVQGPERGLRHGFADADQEVPPFGTNVQGGDAGRAERLANLAGRSARIGLLGADKADFFARRSDAYPGCGIRYRRDAGISACGREGVSDFNVDARLHRGSDGGGVEDLGPVLRHFQGGAVRHFGNGAGGGNLFRVRGHRSRSGGIRPAGPPHTGRRCSRNRPGPGCILSRRHRSR